jgi:hypothetical protein
MTFALDTGGRFVLTARDGGWELEVDGRMVHYCRDPLAAVKYMTETLREESLAEGVAQVVKALDVIDKTLATVTDLVRQHEISVTVAGLLSRAQGTRRECIKRACLDLAGCTEVEFKLRPDAPAIAARAKAILAPWFEVNNVA